jgi:hypothetical protein
VAHRTHDRLPASVDGHVLDPDHLLTLAAVLVERLHQGGVAAHQLGRELEFVPPPLEALTGYLSTPEAVHRGLVGRQHLGCQHALKRIAWGDGLERGRGRRPA